MCIAPLNFRSHVLHTHVAVCQNSKRTRTLPFFLMLVTFDDANGKVWHTRDFYCEMRQVNALMLQFDIKVHHKFACVTLWAHYLAMKQK